MSRQEDSAVAAFVGIGMIAFMVLCVIGLGVAKVWLLGSLLTSGVKAASHDCGQTYPIEGFIRGDWFCPEVAK